MCILGGYFLFFSVSFRSFIIKIISLYLSDFAHIRTTECVRTIHMVEDR